MLFMMKNAFYSILKTRFILKISGIRLTSRFMASQPGLQIIAIHISLTISQSKGNQTIKFGQLIKYDKRNIFLQKLSRK